MALAHTAPPLFFCSRCRQPMSELDAAGQSLHFCHTCKAAWLRPGELAHYLGTEEDLPQLEELQTKAKPSPLGCPGCHVALESLPYAAGEAPVVSRCPKCEGIWCENGTLRSLSRFNVDRKAEQYASDQEALARIDRGNHRATYVAEAQQLPEKRGFIPSSFAAEQSWTPPEQPLEGDPTFCVAILPIAFTLAALVYYVLLPLRLFFGFGTMCVHELGHAVTSWLQGHPALPTPVGYTMWSMQRSLPFTACVSGLLISLIWLGRKQKLLHLVLFASVILVLQLYCSFGLSPDQGEMWRKFGGVGGEFVLGTLLVIGFYYRLPAVFRWDGLRFPAIVLGAYSFLSNYDFWGKVARHQLSIPWGSWLDGSDANGDLGVLRDSFGWSADQIATSYTTLGRFCLSIIIAHYLYFAFRALANRRPR